MKSYDGEVVVVEVLQLLQLLVGVEPGGDGVDDAGHGGGDGGVKAKRRIGKFFLKKCVKV